MDLGQGVWNRAAAGRIVAFEDGGDFIYTAGDATAAYQQPSLGGADEELCAVNEGVVRAIRHIVFVHPGVFVILDDIETKEPASIQFLLHALNAFQLDEGQRIVTIANGMAAARIHLLGSDPMAITQTDQFSVPPEPVVFNDECRGQANQWHLTCDFAATSSVRRLLTVVQIHRTEEVGELLEVEPVEEPRTIGARIGGTSVKFLLSPAAVKVTCHTPRIDGTVARYVASGPPTA